MKTCSKCRTEKPLGEFYRQARGRDGVTAQCKDCETARKAEYKARNPEKIAAQQSRATATWRENHREQYLAGRRQRAKENPEVRAERNARWRASNPEWYREYQAANRDLVNRLSRESYHRHRLTRIEAMRAYGRDHKETRAEQRDRWRKANPERVRTMQQEAAGRHRARRRDAFVESVAVAVLYERDRGVCGLCQKPVARRNASIDHIVPLAVGGLHSYSNCQLAHTLCNVRRQHRGPAQMRLLA